MSKLRETKWANRPRIEKLSGFMYPHLASPNDQRDMLSVMEAQGKRADLQKRIDQGLGTYGIAKPNPPNYSKVPGLVAVRKPNR